MERTQSGSIEREIRVEAAPQTVFEFFTDPEKLVLWMGKVAEIDARPGGQFRLDYNGSDIARGEYLEIEAGRRIVCSWGWEAEGSLTPPGASTVEFTLTPDGDATIVRLVHSGLVEEAVGPHTEGWDYFMPRLAAAAGAPAVVAAG